MGEEESKVVEEWVAATSSKLVWILIIAAMLVCTVAVLLVWINGGA